MTKGIGYCTLGRHEVALSEMRKPPPSAPSRRQCNECANGRKRAAYQPKPAWDWASAFLAHLDTDGDCWEWTGTRAYGYGVISVLGQMWQAHRLSYALHYGDLPPGAFICHHCDNRSCCNPAHIYAGDVQTNSDDAVARNRLNPPIGQRNGHAFLTEDLVRTIRSRYAAGATQEALGAEFGTVPSNVYKIVNYKSWRHVA